jgi:hypothetical protein
MAQKGDKNVVHMLQHYVWKNCVQEIHTWITDIILYSASSGIVGIKAK